ncbi:hypothetical protein EB235_24620 [Mesorhizobium loti R88b]|uniref:Uncharacterized protein n=1 Tax=Mesorhizobium loti R88b TaxID=935548 RepID=A0A6M7WYS3_RHILI|nr:hypothetical protein EB235_24620 [Mesorhizobium loti R88b]
MKILSLRPEPPGGGAVRARFDVEMDDGIRLYDLKLVQARAGWRVYGPQHHGGAVVTFPIAIADQISAEAVALVEHQS